MKKAKKANLEDLVAYLNAAESFIYDLAQSDEKDIHRQRDLIWGVIIKQGERTSLKETKALKELRREMKQKPETRIELARVLQRFINCLFEENTIDAEAEKIVR